MKKRPSYMLALQALIGKDDVDNFEELGERLGRDIDQVFLGRSLFWRLRKAVDNNHNSRGVVIKIKRSYKEC